MGRRHFLFGPTPRAMQESILEGCQVRNAAAALVDSEPIQSRRHFDAFNLEGTRGATTSSFEITSKRHFDAVEHKECGREVGDSCQGRKHVLGPACHMQGALQVKSQQCQPRRKLEGSQPTIRRGEAPQRRHLVCQDHLLWSGAVSAIPEAERPQGLRRSSPSPTLDSQVAALLACPSTETTTQAHPLICEGPRSQTPVKRRVEVPDNLVGGTLRGLQPVQEKPAPRRPKHECAATSLLGGHLRSLGDQADTNRLPSPSRCHRPQDNLAGGACLPVRAH